MIISRTPLRISFVGGGTDLGVFYRKNGSGAVLSTAIDKYVYVIIKERFDELIYVNWTKKEIVKRVEEIEHDLVREAMKIARIEKSVEITTLADIPSEGSGLGSSSSLTVGLLNAFYTFQGIQVSSEKLAQEACKVEIEILGKPIGKQDQYAAAYGGLSEIVFWNDERVEVKKLNLFNNKLRELGANLLLFYTGKTRSASKILSKQKQKVKSIFPILKKMKAQVPKLKSCLERFEFDKLGEYLDQGWQLKKSLLKDISNSEIDEMYEKAKKAGALGGKLCGAGGGGFLLLYVPREKQNNVRRALRDYREMPFMLDRCGSRIIFNQLSDYWK